ncbi:type II toxin-antitoxin system ParD family antitoxin [Rhodomicrobium vannielii ATCC 17100]|uniref:ribbon-helix-helix domain-containing protein n=1 Tax=Rhodomicrobium vannielii TaxID=1069 RepID=UPI00191AE1B6|nr:type II toxin-antitoxin system ParD family antitoxin [Rhodomicrobium vannielii]MBJ7532971.1 type II toxin-antitoxin system ParD family antitoxin [Rhodomicrobium vannielii ATCC 17100]
MRTSKPVTVTLGAQQASLERRLASGEFSSASEVIRAGLRALDREDAILEEALKEKVRASLADDRPSRSASDVFGRLRAHHDARSKAEHRDS